MTHTRSPRTILTATGATTDQTSNVFVVPKASKQFALLVDVTVGASLDLKITLQTKLTDTTWDDMVVGVPMEAISGVSETPMLFGESISDTDMDAASVSIRGQMRAVVVHGNATAATYTVQLKPL